MTGLLGSKVRIDLFEGDERADTIVKKARNKGKYRWEVPAETPAGADYSVRVTDRETGTSDRSETFEID